MPTAKPTPLTAAGKAALEAELVRLVERRQEVVRRISYTRQEGDLSENAGYHQAREDQAHLEGRVQEIEAILRNAVIIDNTSTDGSIRLGSIVVVEDEFGEACFTIVGPAEADPTSGRLSDESPVGRSLLGRRAGDTVEAQTPSGLRALRVVRVE